MSPMPRRHDPRFGWFPILQAVAAAALVVCLLVIEDPRTRTILLVLLALVPIAQLTVFLVRVLRSGRISGTTRAGQPTAFWSATLALALFTLLAAAAIPIALLD